MTRPITIAILGAGSRGLDAYAPYALREPDRCRIVAVADPDPERRAMARERHQLPAGAVFTGWEDFIRQPRMADAVIIATQDTMHTAPAVACADAGYHILLEKPMATTLEDCEKIIAAVERNGVIFGLGFVLRYTPYFRKLRELIASGAIGDLVTFRHLEQVSYWHQAHSFVRGNWRNSVESCPMIVAKCCHDMDILNYLVGKRCLKVSSYGSRKFFRPENRPAGAADRCLACPVESTCLYSAKRFYCDRLHAGRHDWPLNVITHDFTETGVEQALREGPYGRCVFACDNDVVDNQVVDFLYDGGVTGTLTMTAFTSEGSRRSEFYGSHGEIIADGTRIQCRRFGDGLTVTYDTDVAGTMLDSGHGGGDFGLIRDFVAAVANHDQSLLGCSLAEMRDGHRMAFQAELSRLAHGGEFA